MSPRSPRIPTQGHPSASMGDDSGRHRRPESLADVSVRSGPRVSATSLIEVPPARPGPSRSARHQRPTRGGRHAAVRVPAPRPAIDRPPATGTHRAPGTLPIESWLLLGKKRQQVLLASLVAVGIVLLAMPAEQRRDSFDAVNSAAQAVAGVQTEKKAPKPAPEREQPENESAGQDKPSAPKKPAPTPAATKTKPVVEATKPAGKAATDLGPGQSLRTTGSKTVALTFDDGPDPVQTPKILALLDKYQVKAVFCLVGKQVERHPEIVREIVAQGHTLCNHTWDHSLTIGKDKPAEIYADLASTNAAIAAAAPGAEVPFFRAPGGNFTERLVGVAKNSGMTSLYWQVDPRDWDHPEKETPAQHIARVVADVKGQVRPGSIVLSHDFNQPQTIAAYEKLLPYLTETFTLGLPRQAGDDRPEAPQPTETPSAPAPSTPAGPELN